MFSSFPIRRLSAVLISVLLMALVLWLSGVENVSRRLTGFPPWAVVSMLAWPFAAKMHA